jgi:hypothetical protein
MVQPLCYKCQTIKILSTLSLKKSLWAYTYVSIVWEMSKSPEPETLPRCSNIVFIDIIFSVKVKQLTLQLEIVPLHKKKVFNTAKTRII